MVQVILGYPGDHRSLGLPSVPAAQVNQGFHPFHGLPEAVTEWYVKVYATSNHFLPNEICFNRRCRSLGLITTHQKTDCYHGKKLYDYTLFSKVNNVIQYNNI